MAGRGNVKKDVHVDDEGTKNVRSAVHESESESDMEQDENDSFIVSLDEDSSDDLNRSLSRKPKKPKASKKQPNKKIEASKRSRDLGSEASIERGAKRSRRRSQVEVTEVRPRDEAGVPPLNFKYVAERWHLEATHGIDKRIHEPIKALEGVATWLTKIPYHLWLSIFDEKKRKNPYNLDPNSKEERKKSMTSTVVSYYFDGDREGPFAQSWYEKCILPGSKPSKIPSLASACVGMEEPMARLFNRKNTKGLAAAFVMKLLEAKGAERKLELLGKDILEAGALYMKKNWAIWCQRMSLNTTLNPFFADSVIGETNKDDDYDTRYAAITRYDKFLTNRGNHGGGGGGGGASSRGLRRSTVASTEVSTQEPVAMKTPPRLQQFLLDHAGEAETASHGPPEAVEFRVPGWTRWKCMSDQQAIWKKEGERMSVTQVQKHTEKLQLELTKAKKSQGDIVDDLKGKINLVNQLEAQMSEYEVLADVKRSVQKKQEKLGEALCTEDSLEVTDDVLGIYIEYYRTGDSNQFLQNIDSTRKKYNPAAATMLPPIMLPTAPVNLDASVPPAPLVSASVTSSKVSATTSSVVDSVPPLPAWQPVVTLSTPGPSSSGCSSQSSTLRRETEQEPAAKKKKPDQQPTSVVQPIRPMQSSGGNAAMSQRQMQTPFRVSTQPPVSVRASSKSSSGTSSQCSMESSGPQGLPRTSSSKVSAAVPQRAPIISSGSNRSNVLKRVPDGSNNVKLVPDGRMYQSNMLEAFFRQRDSSNQASAPKQVTRGHDHVISQQQAILDEGYQSQLPRGGPRPHTSEFLKELADPFSTEISLATLFPDDVDKETFDVERVIVAPNAPNTLAKRRAALEVAKAKGEAEAEVDVEVYVPKPLITIAERGAAREEAKAKAAAEAKAKAEADAKAKAEADAKAKEDAMAVQTLLDLYGEQQ